MKAIVYLSLMTICLTSQAVLAQQNVSDQVQSAFWKGSGQITVNYGYGHGNLLSNRDVIEIKGGYYVVNRLLIGLTGSLMKEWAGDSRTDRRFSAGPLVRYQFTSSRLAPFAEIAYIFGNPTLNRFVNQAVTFTPGLNFGLLPQVRLEASFNFLIIPTSEMIGQPQLGATFLF